MSFTHIGQICPLWFSNKNSLTPSESECHLWFLTPDPCDVTMIGAMQDSETKYKKKTTAEQQ